jgi:predicted ATP-dependent protease
MFGQPARITARVWLGKGEIIDIEREAALAGPVHQKGVLILSGYLGQRYASDYPLSLCASLVFEQSYGAVEGDSATAAELISILSAIAELPVHQGIAVTGSVNQHGEIQAVGEVNTKIEGFFHICQRRGMRQPQGVILPEANVSQLMLPEEIQRAARDNSFVLWPVRHVDEVACILMSAALGSGPKAVSELHQQVEERLAYFSHIFSAGREQSAP